MSEQAQSLEEQRLAVMSALGDLIYGCIGEPVPQVVSKVKLAFPGAEVSGNSMEICVKLLDGFSYIFDFDDRPEEPMQGGPLL